MAFGRRSVKPVRGGVVIPGDTPTARAGLGEFELGLSVPCLGRKAVPGGGFGQILRHTKPFLVLQSQIGECARVTARRSPPVTCQRLGIILRHPATLREALAEIVLRRHVSLLGGSANPGGALLLIP